MSVDGKRNTRRLMLGTLVIWLSIWIEVGVREHFHRQYAHLDNMAWLALAPLLIVVEWIWGLLVRGRDGGLPHRWPHYFLLSAVMWFWVVVYGGASGNRFQTTFIAAVGVYGGLSIALRVFSKMRDRFAGSRAPAALTTGLFLFVATPPVVVAFQSERMSWPSHDGLSAEKRASDIAGDRPTVVVLLFDELEYQAAEPIRQALVEEGLSVSSRSVEAAGDRTAKVIPAMWTRQSFEQARACGWSAICSGRQMLDFAEVEATWPDIDVVGFYFPYCSMKGLRSCRRETPSPALADEQRLSCAVRRRLGMTIPNSCVLNQHDAWSALVRRVEYAYWKAPVWTQGGVLFAHLPIPHPPGSDAMASLADHYSSGVGKAALLVRDSVRRLKVSGIGKFHVVVTSDHPLRVDMWCSNGTYSKARCANSSSLGEESVPLMAASFGAVSPSLASFRRNDQMFDLVTALRRGTAVDAPGPAR